MLSTSRARRLYVVTVLFVLLVGDGVRYTIGWWGFTALALVLAAIAVVILARRRRDWRFNDLPYPMLAFLALAVVSVAWSFYPAWTALGATSTILTVVAGVAIVVVSSWAQIVADLGVALRSILAASVVFELVVAWIVRGPVLPLFPQPGVDYANLPDPVPPMFYWSRNVLFDDGKIQGIMGNSVLLGFVAVLAIIVFAVQLIDGSVRRVAGIGWLALAVAILALTRSATALLALAAVAAVTAVVLLVRRTPTGRPRVIVGAALAAVVLAGGAVAFAVREAILAVLGKSPDFTNRTEIWDAVATLAAARPVAGWGWVSYWVPGVEPFDDLAFNNGVRQLHAHSAWLDVWFQLGVLGLIAFGAWVLSTLVRSWNTAVDRPVRLDASPTHYTAMALAPLLILVALLAQSLAESRLLVESGLALLVIISVTTKAAPAPAATAAP